MDHIVGICYVAALFGGDKAQSVSVWLLLELPSPNNNSLEIALIESPK